MFGERIICLSFFSQRRKVALSFLLSFCCNSAETIVTIPLFPIFQCVLSAVEIAFSQLQLWRPAVTSSAAPPWGHCHYFPSTWEHFCVLFCHVFQGPPKLKMFVDTDRQPAVTVCVVYQMQVIFLYYFVPYFTKNRLASRFPAPSSSMLTGGYLWLWVCPFLYEVSSFFSACFKNLVPRSKSECKCLWLASCNVLKWWRTCIDIHQVPNCTGHIEFSERNLAGTSFAQHSAVCAEIL